MGNSMRHLTLALLVLATGLTLSAPIADQAFAQRPGGRSGDDDERGRRGGGRRDRGGPPGDRRNNDGDRPAPPRPAAASPSAPTSTSFGTVSESERIRKSATDTIKQHDKSGNGILESDELNDLGMSRGADLNGDGKITHDELVAFRMPKSDSAAVSAAKPASPPKVEADPATAEVGERKLVNDKRKSYRFKSTKERLSSWKLASKDANGDGQVSMHEYASSWTDRTAAEFVRYDKNNDGVITPDEAK